ncbi:MAG: capsid cement protein [Cyanobacteriota bacterium]|nr:capsid cement protein [Cyanobacteriota bacterium]
MKNYVQSGEYLEITASADIDSGELVQYGSLHGVAVADIANGAKGNIHLEGVYTLPKLVAASADACTAGGPVYFSSGSVSGSDSSGTRKLVGYAVAAAAQAATTVQVLLSN